jgi:hypothetical protein
MPKDQWGDGITEDFEKLKKEYAPAGESSVWVHEGEEYYVPWVSMFPKQEGVELMLSACTYSDLMEVTDQDIVTLPEKNGVYFKDKTGKKLTKVKLSEIKDDMVSVILYCKNPVSKDLVLDLKDKDDKVVGKLNFLKNDEIVDLPIRVIKILEGGGDQSINKRVFGESIESYDNTLKGIKDQITNKGLNQALIKPKFENSNFASIKEIPIDFRELSKEGLVKFITPTSTQPHFVNGKTDEVRDILLSKQNELYGEFKGILIFVTIVAPKGREAGFSWTIPRSNNVTIIPNGLFDSITFLHEISHALGLEHTFTKTNYYERNIKITKENIEIYKDNIVKRKKFVDKFKKLKSSNIINFKGGDKKTVELIRYEGQLNIKKQENLLKKEQIELQNYLAVSNKYNFIQAHTDNIMDYPVNEETGKENTNVLANIYHKYQIPIVREGVKIISK